jgi:radical SAM superfamily enzyme YgiQ (UPF0313 family)
MKEVALVNIPYGVGGEAMRPLGLAALGAYLIDNGIRARGFDFSTCQESPQHLVDRYELHQYWVVGLSFYNTNALLAFDFARAIKARNSSAVVVAGGPHVNATYLTVCARHPELDAVIRDEGEESFLHFLERLAAGPPVGSLPGVVHHLDGDIVIGPQRDRIASLDRLPPAVFHFEGDSTEQPLIYFDRHDDRLRRATAMVTSRSCPYRCSFCAIILIGRQWRRATPEKVVSDFQAMENAAGHHLEHVYFLDANFFVVPRRALVIAEQLHNFRPDLTFSFSTRVNQLLRGASFLPELAARGLRAVELGIESGSLSALKRFAKDTTPEDNSGAIRLLREHGLQLFLDFIMFDAEASLDDLDANIRFLEANGLDSYAPWDHTGSHLTPYLGTDIRRHYEEELGFELEDDVLPDPAMLLRDQAVRAVFCEMQRLRPELPRLRRALDGVELALAQQATEPWGREQARLALNAASLRRLPFLVLRRLVRQARSGCNPVLEEALPTLVDDDGVPVELNDFIETCILKISPSLASA